MFSKGNIEYNLRNYRELASHTILRSRSGLESANYKASQLWSQTFPMEIKNSCSLELFKLNIKSYTSHAHLGCFYNY